MSTLYRRTMKQTLYQWNTLRKLSKCVLIVRSYPKLSSSHFIQQRIFSRKHTFNITNTTMELKKKLQKVHEKHTGGFNISIYSMDTILTHPCFEASRISKEDGIILLNACESLNESLPEQRAEYVWKIWEKLRKCGVIDLDVYHHLLMALRCTGAHVETDHVLNLLKNYQFAPTSETYNLLLQCVCTNNNFDDVLFVLSTMKNNGYEINNEGINGVLFGAVKSRGLDEGLQYLRQYCVSMDSDIYTSLLKGVARIRDTSGFDRLLDEIRDKGVELPLRNRASVAESLAMSGLISLMPKVLGPRNDWQSSLMILCNLFARCSSHKNYPAMFEIMNYMKDMLLLETPVIHNLSPCAAVEIFITYMVRMQMPINDLVQFCFEQDTEIRLKRAAYISLRCKLFDYSVIFFEAMKSINLPLRPHYFWPMFLSCHSNQDIFNVLSTVQRLEVELDFTTLYSYVMKRLNLTKPYVLEELEKYGVGKEKTITPLLGVALLRNQMPFVVELCRKYKSHIDYSKLYFMIASNLAKYNDFNVILQICPDDDHHLFKIFHQLLFHFKYHVKLDLVEKFIKLFKENHVNLYQRDLSELKSFLNIHNLDEKTWLEGLTNELNSDVSKEKPHLRDMNIEQLEDHVVKLRSNRYSLRQALRRLLIMYAEVGNVERVIELKQELDEKKMRYSLGMRIAILKTFCMKNEFDKAYKLFLDMKKDNSHEKLRGEKFLLLASEAAKKGQVDVMFEILRSRTNTKENGLTRNCFNLIQTVTIYIGVETANKLFEFLIENKYCEVNIMLLAPIIKFYLSRDEVEKATLVCLQFADRYRLMPMKKHILCKLASLAVAEQIYKTEPKFQTLLNKVLQTSGYLYGSSHTNMTYVICLAELGLLATLRKFLTDSYTGIEVKLMWHECNKLSDQNKSQTLINLLKVFKDMPHVNIEPIYVNLMKIYCRAKDLQAARDLLKSIEESNRVPSVMFIDMMAELQCIKDFN